MTICFVTPEFVTEERNFDGGLANYLYRVSLGLLQLGHKPIVVVSSHATEIIYKNEVEVHRVKYKNISHERGINLGYQSHVLNAYIKSIIENAKIDIIQYASYLGVGFHRINSIPTVVRVSSYSPFWAKYYNKEVNKDENFIEITAMKNADAAFGPSKIITTEIFKNENIKAQIIETPFVKTVSDYDYSLFNKNLKNKKYLLFFGTVGVLKGVKTIADTIHSIFSEDENLFFVFIGKDAGYEKKKMMEYVYEKAAEFSDRVLYFDKMNHEKLYPFIENAYAVILPSRIDNFPNTCIEAMAHGKIVIGTRNTGFDQLIDDKINGFLCERDKPDDLLQKIEKVLNLPDNVYKNIQIKAKERIELLKPEIVIEQLLGFFNSVIEKFSKADKSNQFYQQEYLYDIINELVEKNQTISKKAELQSQTIYNSRSYRLGNFLLKPVSCFKKLFK